MRVLLLVTFCCFLFLFVMCLFVTNGDVRRASFVVGTMATLCITYYVVIEVIGGKIAEAWQRREKKLEKEQVWRGYLRYLKGPMYAIMCMGLWGVMLFVACLMVESVFFKSSWGSASSVLLNLIILIYPLFVFSLTLLLIYAIVYDWQEGRQTEKEWGKIKQGLFLLRQKWDQQ